MTPPLRVGWEEEVEKDMLRTLVEMDWLGFSGTSWLCIPCVTCGKRLSVPGRRSSCYIVGVQAQICVQVV